MKRDERESILVVDDTPSNIDVITGILSSAYQVRAAVSGPWRSPVRTTRRT